MKIPSEAELPSRFSPGAPGVDILRNAWHRANSNYAKIRLVHAIKYLGRIQDRQHEGDGLLLFVDSFDAITDPREIREKWSCVR